MKRLPEDPKLFGEPMEWDDQLGYWKDYAHVSAYGSPQPPTE